MSMPRKAPAFYAREMFAHSVDFTDGRAGAQKRAGHALFVLKRYSFDRRDPVRRGAAGHQHQDKIVRAGAVGQSKCAIGGLEARSIRYRMPGLDHPDLAKVTGIAMPC